MADEKKGQIRIELVKGLAATLPKQRATIKALGLNKVHSSVVRDATPVTMGMIRVVEHMVEIEEI